MLHLRLRENKRIHRRLFPMLSFKELEEKKKTNVKINPKLDDLKEKTKHGEDCTCIKCDKRRENDEGDDGPTVESYRVLARDKGDKGRPAQFRYKDEKDANKFADSIKSKGGKATVAKEEVEQVDERHVTASMGRHAKKWRESQARQKDREDNAKWEEKARTHKWDGKTWNKRDKPTHEKGTGPHARKLASEELELAERKSRLERTIRKLKTGRLKDPLAGKTQELLDAGKKFHDDYTAKKKQTKEEVEPVDETYYDTNTRGISTKGGFSKQYNKPGKLSRASLNHERKSKNPELRMSKKELRKSMEDDANYEKKMGRSKPTPSNLKSALKKQSKIKKEENESMSQEINYEGVKSAWKKAWKKDQDAKKERRIAKGKEVPYAALTASHEPEFEEIISEEWFNASAEVSAEYFFAEGINEEGLDQVIDEVGLDDFVEFVLDPVEELNEERAAKKAKSSAPSYEKVKAKVDAGDAARKKAGKGEYAKTAAAKRNYGDEDNTNYDDDKTPAAKKPAAKPVAKVTVRKPKAEPKKKAATKAKVEKAVKSAKKSQPTKPTSKKGLLGKIKSAVSKGVEKHQKAVGDVKKSYSKQRAKGKEPEKRVKEFAKGVKSGVKTAVKFAKDVKKVVAEEYNLEEEGIADILARLEKKRIRQGGDPKESPLPAMRKYHDKKKASSKKKMKEALEVAEAKVDAGKSPETKEKDRNIRKFGVGHNVSGHGKLRRSLHRMNRGDKKIPGDKSAWVEMESVDVPEKKI